MSDENVQTPANTPFAGSQQTWTESGYPIVDGKYLDLSTGTIKTVTADTMVSVGPPAVEIYWVNRTMTGRKDPFRSFLARAFVDVTEYLKRIGELLERGSVEIFSLNATKYAVNVVVGTDLSHKEMMIRIRQCSLFPALKERNAVDQRRG
ncbi:hypothetical protein QQX98_000873 [Neonectria punicea]|uniref:Uncharacterized protein n=1 Tax=Neonectria punicea TaxID=979145 RepID=A0ABR1HR25_9HYPO